MNIYRLKVSLADFKGIRRWFDMSGNCTFDDLHKMIFVAYDRYDQHLYKFYFPQEKTGSLEKIYMSPLIVQHPVLHKDAVADRSYDLPYAARGLPKPKLLATNQAVLDDAELREKQEFFYLFDMGDEWWHKVRVEKIEHEDIKGKSKKSLSNVQAIPHHSIPIRKMKKKCQTVMNWSLKSGEVLQSVLIFLKRNRRS
jgi:pRiA4b ORF-3-like protein